MAARETLLNCLLPHVELHRPELDSHVLMSAYKSHTPGPCYQDSTASCWHCAGTARTSLHGSKLDTDAVSSNLLLCWLNLVQTEVVG
jgi:hypothetical protein